MKKLTSILTLLLLVNIAWSQDELKYSPVTNINSDEVWPVVKYQLDFNKMSIASLDYGQGVLKTHYSEYYRGLSRARAIFVFTFVDNVLNVEMVNIQTERDGYWQNSSKSALFKTEYKIEARMADGIRNILESPEKVNESKETFYNSLDVHNVFYENATELAGKRWFDTYLKDREVDWNLTFVDITENTSAQNNDYKYKESYVYQTGGIEFDFLNAKFYITKYTNSDENIFTKKRSKINVKGVCRYLNYDLGSFYVVITEKGEEVSSQPEPERKSVADELIKLKGLLDAGVITQEEFDAQKEKLLK